MKKTNNDVKTRKHVNDRTDKSNHKIALTIIIKALNEEKHIAKCIESCIAASRHLGCEIILVDSLSNDNTVNIAKNYDIRIVQLKNGNERTCGIGPQLGFQLSKGKYVCIIDADMILSAPFLKQAIAVLDNKNNNPNNNNNNNNNPNDNSDDNTSNNQKNNIVAGVGGLIIDAHENNLISKMANKRIKENADKDGSPKFVSHLPGIATYSRNALMNVGYMSNPSLYSNEELELGYRLITSGYKLMKLPIMAVTHYRDDKNAFLILLDKYKSRYLAGGGQVLRSRLFKKDFFMHLKRQKVYLATIVLWLTAVIFLAVDIKYISTIIVALMAGFIILAIRKGGAREAAYSFLSWNLTALQIILGFIMAPRKDMNINKDKFKIIK